MKKSRLLGAVRACLLSSASAATVVYDNGVTSTNSTIVSQPSAGQIVFDDFVLSSSTNVTGIQFRGGYNSITRPDDFSKAASGSDLCNTLFQLKFSPIKRCFYRFTTSFLA